MEYLDRLHNDNLQTVESLLGRAYRDASSEDTLPATQVAEANEALSEYLYGAELSDLVKRNKVARLNRMHDEIVAQTLAPEDSLRNVDIGGLGIVVVRPEAMDLVNECKDLLNSYGLKTVLDKKMQIEFEQYWSLYGPGLSDPESRYDFPTRTLNYINKDLLVLVVSGTLNTLHLAPISDFITDYLKGRQGSYDPGTLRGDIAYTALRDLVSFDGNRFLTPNMNLAMDPIGAYRQLVCGGLESDRMHSSADLPLLFYAGQSVHVPDNEEMRRDIRLLLTEEEINEVIEVVNCER